MEAISGREVGFQYYDVTADGNRFLVNTNNLAASPPLTMVVNWTAGLKK